MFAYVFSKFTLSNSLLLVTYEYMDLPKSINMMQNQVLILALFVMISRHMVQVHMIHVLVLLDRFFFLLKLELLFNLKEGCYI